MKTNNPSIQKDYLYEMQELRAVTGPAIRPGGLALTERALSLCRLPAGAAVLDVGCGIGATLRYLRGVHGLYAAGLDLSATLLSECRRAEPMLPLVRGTAECLPFGADRFGALFCECVLSLVPDAAAALREAARVLRRGGWLVVSDLYARAKQGAIAPSRGSTDCLTGAVTQTTLESRMRTAGFRIQVREDYTPLLTRLAVELIFAHGSLRRFWESACPGRAVGLSCRPGYGLWIARREN